MYDYVLYLLAGIFLVISFKRDKKKTKMALKKAWKSFENILPQFLTILAFSGMVLALLSPDVISRLLGQKAGWQGMIIASIIGSITLIPAFIAFPIAAMLLKNGAGFAQIAVFVSTLMMVGIVTLPLEIKCFGKKISIMRNMFAYLFSFMVALVIGVVLG
ncbi:MAG: permease [Actinobacteria bacterium RBG_13_35_12]|uniref:Permease n=1 Tax=Candidatus Sediminicultor quintus TaxID=1797291 RepID=A0A1F5AES7_9BACT|nr:MAG: permease [Actinobacteria bacterium RBG_13_35_12]OGD16888.1 MAG: permease [Candidatus Atribacteria bacterium RBG_19FT_COMBO_35_14]